LTKVCLQRHQRRWRTRTSFRFVSDRDPERNLKFCSIIAIITMKNFAMVKLTRNKRKFIWKIWFIIEEFHKFRCQSYKTQSNINDHPWGPKIIIVVDRRSLFRGYKCSKWDLKIVVAIDRWSLFEGGHLLCKLAI